MFSPLQVNRGFVGKPTAFKIKDAKQKGLVDWTEMNTLYLERRAGKIFYDEQETIGWILFEVAIMSEILLRYKRAREE